MLEKHRSLCDESLQIEVNIKIIMEPEIYTAKTHLADPIKL